MNTAVLRTFFVPVVQGDIKVYTPLFLLCVAMLFIGWAIRLRARQNLSMHALATWLMVSSVVAAIVYWFRYEGVLYFDVNGWLVVALAVFIGYGIRFGYITSKRNPRQKQMQQAIEIKEKYLPKKKNR